MVCARGECTHRSVGGDSRHRINGRTEAWATGLAWAAQVTAAAAFELVSDRSRSRVMRVLTPGALQPRPAVSSQMER